MNPATMCPSLFHLHFNTPNVSEAATRLCEARLTLQRRFGSVRGEGTPSLLKKTLLMIFN
ncbi:hypothetical protein ACFQJ8_23780 [Halocatena marina]|uniref:hypothetical protein n=1 Tax=Halocatena marina TaxID=2934937 RepID=UPI00360DF45C